jgi:hypothetical protein
MDKSSEMEFHVDEQYENEKGVFTVVAKEKDEMVIRWENGEEARTDIELQRRIMERREWEEHKRTREAEAAAKPARKAGGGAHEIFTGLAPTDFKKSASGTRWRARNQLGGAVTTQMGASSFKFSSWAFGNKAEMHVQDGEHRLQDAEDQARFFIRIDQQALYYGFQVARPGDTAAAGDWEGVMRWLALPENDAVLRAWAAEDMLRVENPAHPASGALQPSESGWQKAQRDAPLAMDTVADYIRQTPESMPFTLQLTAVIDKEAAVAGGAAIARTIARLFTRLLPLYRAAVTR